MLRQSLKSLGGDPALLCERAGINATARAETVPVEGFVALANAWRQARSEMGQKA
jgi:16S rRNA (adenine1518-N6/adenine1519-N6)-dimethyltransferase